MGVEAGEKICIVGSGNWGSAVARIVGRNAQKHDVFRTQVEMWTFEEIVDGRKLSELINEKHENVKYLPGFPLPPPDPPSLECSLNTKSQLKLGYQ